MAKPKKIINDPATAVSEFIDGLLLQYPNHLLKLQGQDVLVAREATATSQSSRVHLISGGGSGHEPSHAGWLGQGMLSAAVLGGMFASPSVAAVLQAIRIFQSNSQGVLLIVKNYTGDRLNFGMAAEKAMHFYKIPVEMVVVADDCAVPRSKGITGARGVAGTVLVHKICGAAAVEGKLSLQELAVLGRQVNAHMGSLGIALNAVTVPGAATTNDRLDDDDTIEIGLGIHGEAGMRQSPLLTADAMARELIATIQSHGRVLEDGTSIGPLFEAGDEIVVLVNNLGGTSNFEMSLLTRACVTLLESDEFGAKAARVLVGSFMTSFDMHGVSLTILNVQGKSEWTAWLDASTTAPAWPVTNVVTQFPRASSILAQEEDMTDDASKIATPPVTIESFGTTAKIMIQEAATKLAEAEPLLTKYDTIVGDGDCGITMKRGATEILNKLPTLPTDHPATLYSALADAVSASMGGTSGVLMELFFRKMSATVSQADSIGAEQLVAAFDAGVQAVSFYGGAQVGSRTMLDALVPAAQAAVGGLAAAAQEARAGANGTATMKVASAGRSNYLSEETLDGTPDPGAVAVAIVLEAMASKVSS